MNYFSSTFLVSLLLLWLGGRHVVQQIDSNSHESFPQQTSERTLPRS